MKLQDPSWSGLGGHVPTCGYATDVSSSNRLVLHVTMYDEEGIGNCSTAGWQTRLISHCNSMLKYSHNIRWSSFANTLDCTSLAQQRFHTNPITKAVSAKLRSSPTLWALSFRTRRCNHHWHNQHHQRCSLPTDGIIDIQSLSLSLSRHRNAINQLAAIFCTLYFTWTHYKCNSWTKLN